MHRNEDGALELSVWELRALAAHASTDLTRPHVNCVTFEPSLGRAFATDGHRLAVLACNNGPQPDAPRITVPLRHAEIMLRALNVRGRDEEALDGEPILVEGGQLSSGPVKVKWSDEGCRPPPIDAVLQDHERRLPPAETIGLNPSYLVDLKLIVEACESGGIPAMSIGGPLDAVRFTCGGWTMLLMPVRL